MIERILDDRAFSDRNVKRSHHYLASIFLKMRHGLHHIINKVVDVDLHGDGLDAMQHKFRPAIALRKLQADGPFVLPDGGHTEDPLVILGGFPRVRHFYHDAVDLFEQTSLLANRP
jgi:hypothetical protein